MSREVALPAGSAPYAIARTPDGALWVTLVTAGVLARLAPEGDGFTLHEPVAGPCQPMQVAVGADGSVWYTRGDDRLGRLDGAGGQSVVELPAGSAPYGICAAPDGAIWFTARGLNQVGCWTPAGEIRLIDLPVPDAGPAMVAVAGDGAVWAALNTAGALARVHGGEAGLIELPSGSAPVGVAAGGDGVWYADIGGGRVGHADPAGAVESVTFDDPACRPHAVAADPDGGCWVTLWASGQLARVTPGGAVEQYPLPGREPHGLLVTATEVWVAMESGSLVAVERRQRPGE
jgi:virginiamycin B lyase